MDNATHWKALLRTFGGGAAEDLFRLWAKFWNEDDSPIVDPFPYYGA